MVLPPPPQKTKNKTQKLITIPTLPLQINNKKQNQKKKTKLMTKQVYSLKLCLQTDYRTCPGQSVQWPRLFFHIKRYKGISTNPKINALLHSMVLKLGTLVLYIKHTYALLSVVIYTHTQKKINKKINYKVRFSRTSEVIILISKTKFLYCLNFEL